VIRRPNLYRSLDSPLLSFVVVRHQLDQVVRGSARLAHLRPNVGGMISRIPIVIFRTCNAAQQAESSRRAAIT